MLSIDSDTSVDSSVYDMDRELDLSPEEIAEFEDEMRREQEDNERWMAQPNEDEEETRPAESLYNNGKGVQYALELQPLPIPAAPPKKTMKKAPLVKRAAYIHEADNFADVLETALAKLERPDLDFIVVAGQLRTKFFTVNISVPYGGITNQPLKTKAEFDNALEKATGRKTPTIKLCFDELKKTPMEEEIDEVVQQLMGHHKCNNAACGSGVVWCILINGVHVRLTAQNIKLWATYIVEKTPNVDLFTPPDRKEFRVPTVNDDVDDIELLASRRLNKLRGSTQPNIVVNNDFAGLGAAFQGVAQMFAPAPPNTTQVRLDNRPRLFNGVVLRKRGYIPNDSTRSTISGEWWIRALSSTRTELRAGYGRIIGSYKSKVSRRTAQSKQRTTSSSRN
ncbi:hypothetical protein MKEN_00201400 [Mycena kentingensis (nom. inval.)]|nr:hypothetical protein MKEN_00201400 [Mycena kentingensis (nom. inval.)]